jgi:hypothetical protein
VAAISLNHHSAMEILERAWSELESNETPIPAQIKYKLSMIISTKDVTFKYILVTGLLGKCTARSVHPRAIQTSSTLIDSYDARSLCHGVVVPFEKTKGNLFGLSNEPFVNKPARHPEHRKDNRQLRNKSGAEGVHDVLEFAHTAKPEIVFAMLVEVLRRGKKRADNQIIAQVHIQVTCQRLSDFLDEFLQESDGGSRLAAVVGAFYRLLNEGFDVRVYPPNYSDQFARTAGDVEIRAGQQILSAIECKHRPMSLDDVRHGIRKARKQGVSEYVFVAGSGLSPGQSAEICSELLGCREIDTRLITLDEIKKNWVGLTNPIRRQQFGDVVVSILRNDMKRSEVANQAAEIWNRLKE